MFKRLMFNTKQLSQFILRRDRFRLPIWILSITLTVVVVAAAYPGLFPTLEERQALAIMMENPAIIFMLGPSTGLDNYTVGAMFGHEMLIFTGITAAIMNILLFTRHTRSDEEEGRIEVIRSLPVGRLANITSTTIILFIANIVLGLLIGLGLTVLNIESIDFESSLLFGLSIGVMGIFFMGVTAVFAQLAETSRGAIGFSFAFMILIYIIRGIGDVSYPALSWVAPFTWIVKTEVFVSNNWWPLIITLVVSLLIIALAYYLNSIRDLEAGFIPAKPGRSEARSYLKSPLGLGIRILRLTIISWLLGIFVIGLSYGSIFGEMDTFLENPVLAEVLPEVEGYSKEVLFLSFLNIIMSMLCAIPALIITLKIKGEENRGRIQHFLSKRISRNQIIGSYLFLAIVAAIFSLFLSGLGLWLAIIAVMENPISFGTIISSAIIYLPALLFMIGLSITLIGLYPKGSSLIWIYLGYTFFCLYLGEILGFPEWMKKLTPFGFIPQLPVDDVNYLTLSLMTIISIGFIFLGFLGYKKRDIYG